MNVTQAEEEDFIRLRHLVKISMKMLDFLLKHLYSTKFSYYKNVFGNFQQLWKSDSNDTKGMHVSS